MKKNAKGILWLIALTASLLMFTACPGTVNGNSGKETESTINPAAVTELKAASGDSYVNLKWTNPKAESFTGIEIYYGESASSLSKCSSIENTTTTSYKKEGLTNGKTYYFRVDALFGEDDEGNAVVYKSTIVNATPIETSIPAISSVDFAKQLTIGWNLGNTLDSTDSNTNYGAGTETAWGLPVTTKGVIDAVAAAGFKVIRIPVSWHNHVSTDSNYTINSEWLNRVKTIVDWAIEDNLYVIINIHHDNMSVTAINSTPGYALSTDTSIQSKSKSYISKVWTQIATTFADYDEHLVFELLNEPRDIDGKVWGNEWWLGSPDVPEGIVTAYEQAGLDAIRATGGNNADRFVMAPSYAASSTTSMINKWKMPSDSASDKLIFSIHAYSPYNFAMSGTDTTFDSSDEQELDSLFSYLKTSFIDKGTGVVMGETSCSNKDNLSEREKWFTYYFGKLYEKGIPSVLWDNMVYSPDGNEDTDSGYNGEHHGYLNRKTYKWYFPTLIEAAMKAVGITNYSIPDGTEKTVTANDLNWDDSSAVTVNSTTAALGWNNNYKLPQSSFSNVKEGSILKISFENSGASIKIINGSWTTYSDGTIVNGAAGGDGVITASKQDLYYVLTASDASAWKNQDMYIAGQNGTLTGVKLQN